MNTPILDIIQSNINDYVNSVTQFWRSNPDVLKVLDKIYFNNQYSYSELLREGNIIDFESGAINKPSKRELCTAEEFYVFEHKIDGPVSLEQYEIFDFIECISQKDLLDTKTLPDYLVKKDFHKRLDRILLKHLTDYKSSGNGVFEKKITDKLSFSIDFKFAREGIGISLTNYVFPYFQIRFANQEYYQRTDVQTFLFTDSDSFIIFYIWTRSLLLQFKQPGIRQKYEQSKPLVYSQNMGSTFIISNHYEKIEEWNHFISTLLNLFNIHFRLYESWLLRILK